MPVSVLDIDVRDESFRKFQALFDKYQTALGKMPAAWDKVDKTIVTVTESTEDAGEAIDDAADSVDDLNEKIDETSDKIDAAEKNARKMQRSVRTVKVEASQTHKNFVDLGASLMAQQEILHKSTLEQMKMTQAVGHTNSQVDVLERKTKGVAKHLRDAVSSVVKWSTISSLATGLLGAGSLWGIERLASNAGAARRSSMGLGITSGEEQSFGINFQRLFDPNSVLANVQSARNDPSKYAVFSNLGLNPMSGASNAELANQMTLRAKSVYDQGGMPMARAMGLDQIYSEQDLVRLHKMTVQEITDLQAKHAQDQKTLTVNDKLLERWQDLTRSLSISGQKLENVFIRDLGRLAEPIARLSDAFSEAVDKVMRSENLEKWIDDLARGIESLATWLSGPGPENTFKWFMRKLDELATALGNVSNWFVRNFGGGEIEDRPGKTAHIANGGGGSAPSTFGNAVTGFRRHFWDDPGATPSARTEAERFNAAHAREQQAALRYAEDQRLLPVGAMGGIYKAESSNGTDLSTSSAGARGPFQLMAATAAQYGVKNPDDFGESSRGAADYFNYLYHYNNATKGSLLRSEAGYNWGEGNVADLINGTNITGKNKQAGTPHPDDWQHYLPDETKKYLVKVTMRTAEIQRQQGQQLVLGGGRGGAGGNANVTVNINNNTAANVTTQAAQVAAQ